MIVEILSASTELRDRGPKRRDYQRLASLRHYVLLAQDSVRAEVFSRTAEGWLSQELEGPMTTLPPTTIGAGIPLAEI